MNHIPCLIGLGNPGKEYHYTRHNVGVLFTQYFCTKNACQPFIQKKKYHVMLSQNICHCTKYIVANPTTYMNHSGNAVGALVTYYHLDPKAIIVAHDDLDIPFGSYKISTNKNAAGHNGVQSIIDALGTKNFTRLRIGIDARTPAQRQNQPGKDYVLERFNATQLQQLPQIFDVICRESILRDFCHCP